MTSNLRKLGLALLILSISALPAFGQESGNRIYDKSGERAEPSNGIILTTENKDVVPVPYVEAYVLMNAAPDGFVAMFGAAQEGATPAESNQKVNAQLEQFLSAIEKLGVKRGDTYVDMISQNRVYNFVTGNDNVIREKLAGFETKKTISVRYQERAVLEQLMTAAARVSIFDLIKVDYVINDMSKIRSRLFEEASTVIKRKEGAYKNSLGLNIKRAAVAQEKYETHYPAELYETYKAFESGAVETDYGSNRRIIRERKSSTSFLEPLDSSAFDTVINAHGIEPMVQFTLFLRVRYSFGQ